MKVLVAYIDDAHAPALRNLRLALGRNFAPSALPFVSAPIASDLELEQRLRHLRTLDGYSAGSNVLVQDEHTATDMSAARAIECLRAHPEWTQFLEDWGAATEDIALEEKETDRCWVILAEAATGGMPPGSIFLVDKATGSVFNRRYVDLVHVFRELESPA